MLTALFYNVYSTISPPIHTNPAPSSADADLPRHQIPKLVDLCTLEILRNPSTDTEKLSKRDPVLQNIFENFPQLKRTDKAFPVVNFPELLQNLLNSPDAEMKAHGTQFIWIFLKAKLQFDTEYTELLRFADTTQQNWFDKWSCKLSLQEVEDKLELHDPAFIKYKHYPKIIIDLISSVMDTALCEFEVNKNSTPRLDVKARDCKGQEYARFSGILSEMSELTTIEDPQESYVKKIHLLQYGLNYIFIFIIFNTIHDISENQRIILQTNIFLNSIYMVVQLYKYFSSLREQSRKKYISSISENFRSRIVKSKEQRDAAWKEMTAMRLIKYRANQIKPSENLREHTNQAIKLHHSFQQLFKAVNHPA